MLLYRLQTENNVGIRGIYADALSYLCTSTPKTTATSPELATGQALPLCRRGGRAQWWQEQMKSSTSRGRKRYEARSGLEIPVRALPVSGYPTVVRIG